jgi:hypothetical protein
MIGGGYVFRMDGLHIDIQLGNVQCHFGYSMRSIADIEKWTLPVNSEGRN